MTPIKVDNDGFVLGDGFSTWAYLNANFGNPYLGWQLASLLISMHDNDSVDWVEKTFETLFHTVALRVKTWPTDEHTPKALAIETESCLIVGINGTDSKEQVKKYLNPFNAYAYNVIDEKEYPAEMAYVNWQFWKWGVKVAMDVYAGLANHQKPVLFIGHSYGGAIATCAARVLGKYAQHYSILTMTFGAPKSGGAGFYSVFNYQKLLRYINSHDPVPGLPPNEGEVGLPIKGLLKPAHQLLWPRLIAGPGGVKLTDDFKRVADNHSGITPDILSLIFDWQNDKHNWAYPPNHTLEAYINKLFRVYMKERKAFPVEPVSVTPPRLRPKIIGPKPNVVPQLPIPNIVFDGFVFSLLRGATMSGGYGQMPTSARPKVIRVTEHIYAVTWMGKQIFGQLPKGSARVHCNKLIALLKRAAFNDTWNSALFMEAMALWVAAAQVGGEGWNPNPYYIT